MKCERCGRYGDWLGDGSQWRRIHERPAVRALYRCVECGNTQRIR